MIPVSKAFLPPKEEYLAYLNDIWERGEVTNNGKLIQKLEHELKQYLGVKHLFIVSNGTVALELAIRALELQGEIITTPFSFPATTSAIALSDCTPVFADIELETLCLDPSKIEEKITSKTQAILATHVYGNCCEINGILKIANEHQLKIIYDAAHSFGTTYQGQSVLCFGDISIISLHAFKVINMVEGGAIMTNDEAIAEKIYRLRYFGLSKEGVIQEWGINGKSSELHAAMGLCNLKYLPDILTKRKILSEYYEELLEGLPLKRPKLREGLQYNYAYYPIIFQEEQTLLEVAQSLAEHGIGTKRYFYPSLNTLKPIKKKQIMKVSEWVAERVLCLPLYYDLKKEQVSKIASLIKTKLTTTNE